ncbi:MAG: hypothetical protein GX767_07800, partial [Firmicutes bacterium]|nr:hypothetical protein [Bacillota bacterium]
MNVLPAYFLKKYEEGQSLVEFALILPVLLLLILGLLQFAFILTSQILMTSAAREGVRLAAVGGEDTAIKNRIL